MRVHPAVIDYDGPIVIVGFGSIGRGALPLILRHIHSDRERMVVIDPNDSARRLCELEGVRFEKIALRPDNYREILKPMVAGGYLVNLSVDVSSAALIKLCREIGALYIDTCIEPWAGGYLDSSKPLSMRTNYALREEVRSIRGEGPTALIAHGANPGMVSHLYKRALVRLAADMGHTVAPQTPEPYFAVYQLWKPVWDKLAPEASAKVRKGNYERIFDAARQRVRAWEKANVR